MAVAGFAAAGPLVRLTAILGGLIVAALAAIVYGFAVAGKRISPAWGRLLDIGEVLFSDLHDLLDRTFRHIAEAKGVDFLIHVAPDLPLMMQTDTKRVQQVLRDDLAHFFTVVGEGPNEVVGDDEVPGLALAAGQRVVSDLPEHVLDEAVLPAFR